MTVACHPLARAVQPLVRRAAPDAALVARFVADRDEPAFAELVRRHGPAVLAVCRHVTRHTHDADDAFQATFLVLARKAHTLDPARPLGAWLRGVAVRAGHKATRRRREVPLVEVARPDVASDPEAVAAVRAAVASLPPHQRTAVERCELLGRSRADVAAELGVPPGTLSSRLALARRALAARLRRQGFAPVAVVVPPTLLAAARASASEVSSRRVVELAEAVMRTTTWHGWAVGLMAVAVATVGVGLASEPAPVPRPSVVKAKADAGQLFLLEHSAGGPAFLWLDPDGGRPLRLAEAEVRAAGVDLPEMISLGADLAVRRSTVFAQVNAVRPNGEVPLTTRSGMALLAPTDPPTVRPLAPGVVGRGSVLAWSPDGRVCVYRDEDMTHQLLDTTTGERSPLAVPDRHDVLGWSPAGDWLLTQSDDRSPLARLFGGSKEDGRLHRVARDGTAAGLTRHERVSWPRLSPDGTRLLHWSHAVRTTDDVAKRQGFAVRVTDLDAAALSPPVAVHDQDVHSCWGMAWSPDGRRIAYAELRMEPDRKSARVHLWVCDADGGNRREVPLPTGVTSVVVLAWR